MDNQVLLDYYQHNKSVKAVARWLGCSEHKARKLLITAGVRLKSPVTQRITSLREEGMPAGMIADQIGVSRKAVMAHEPYVKAIYAPWTPEEDALVIDGKVPDGRTKNACNVRRMRLNTGTPLRIRHNTPLARIRQSKNLSQAELSAASGVSLSTIRQFEGETRDIRKASIDIIERLAKTLECSYKDLLP